MNIKKKLDSINKKFILGIWNIGIIVEDNAVDKIVKEKNKVKIEWLKHNYKDRFFADPFLLYKDDKFYYILAEEFIFWENIGKIVLLKIEKKRFCLVERKIIIDEKYHLSFPFVDFENKYILPEGFASGRWYAYKYDEKFNIVEKIEMVNRPLIDTVIWKHQGKTWLFSSDSESPLDVERLFCSENGYPGEYSECLCSPIKCNIKNARSAGNIFSHKKKFIRPVQDSEEIYGCNVRLMEILNITNDRYEEKEIGHILSSDYNIMGLHTFNVYDDCIIVDGYNEHHSYLIKPLSIKAPLLMKKWNAMRKE